MKPLHLIKLPLCLWITFIFSGCGPPPPPAEKIDDTYSLLANDARHTDKYTSQRNLMVSLQLESRGITDRSVLAAMRTIPRHEFVPDEYKEDSYIDHPLPIGFGQTISQPYIVALMTELLDVNKKSKVLEVGTGSGYQAAVLSRIVKEVYSVEIIEELRDISSKVLRRTGCSNVRTLKSDGYYGWDKHAPYDAIIVTCASEFIPPPLINQLKNGGRMCIPVGPPFKVQHLLLVKKSQSGKITTDVITEVRFVPLLRSSE